ncbi:GntR family transcriptional regulator [Dysgonomonas sp. PH5-45]|uniref:GntR family transcriptional regulator n=1 Tax=unclassified Dysgonomonas TaxID=2630389 RepID=UPI002473F975|nr:MULTISPECIES: GntR family transcriptional regulator [unclassified Dysgonomonas]MDH6353700.1 GntR family transcriptional regulator [Dysgonomonas sp. PH5-45]MDH6386603.1 GntR family transcriptional regulator [Dysgonomonas sp. PH5-37]
MEYHKNKPIYLQIADAISFKIIFKEWTSGTKIPTVKELAKDFDVNHNTLMRSLEILQTENVISSKRGIGMFVKEESYNNALGRMKKSFYENQVPDFFTTMNALKITLGELINLYKENKENKKTPQEH